MSYPQQPGWNAPQQQQGWSGLQSAPQYGSTPHHAEQGGLGAPKYTLNFSEQSIRAAFVRKVFITVAAMLSVVALMGAFPFFHKPTMQFVHGNLAIYLLGYIFFIVVYVALICCESVRRSFPTNIVCLAILTISIGLLNMVITAYHSFSSVFLCFIITAAACGFISLFATVTDKDLTSCMGIMCILTFCLAMFGLILMLVSIFTLNIRILYVVYATLGALLFMFWLAIDIQMIMGGKNYEISPEEHIFAAIALFMDIIQIFWFILMIFGDRN
jgi:FtsH-binding integral membrane protein